jgi:hypothetical protein
MPPTLVHAALGALLAVALLDGAYSRRAVVVVALAAALPDLDAPLSLVVPGAHGAVLHTLFVPLGVALALWWDERHGGRLLRARAGAAGVQVAWTAILAYAVAGTGLDLFNVATANPVWPVDTMFYNVVGRAEYSTTEGFVQTFYRYDPTGRFIHYLGQRGRPPGYCNPSAWTGGCGQGDTGGERLVPLLQSGWQAALVLSAVVVAAARDYLEGVGR